MSCSKRVPLSLMPCSHLVAVCSIRGWLHHNLWMLRLYAGYEWSTVSLPVWRNGNWALSDVDAYVSPSDCQSVCRAYVRLV